MSLTVKENSWKCSDANNGFINQKSEIINADTKSAVVQVTRTGGTKIMVVPKKKRPNKEKLLIALILALLMFCGMLVIMVFNKRSQNCTGEYFTFLFIVLFEYYYFFEPSLLFTKIHLSLPSPNQKIK